jgi:endonuclease III
MKDKDLTKKGGEITRRLIGHYGTFKGRKGTPFAVLINTILSQNTNDKNSDVAFERLFLVYDTPEKLANAPEEKIKSLIKIGGLYEIKAKRIKDISRLIMDEYGGNIDFVCEADPEAARKELLGIKGVGPKTADCVLIFACGRDLIPVDTHIFRISKRLGIAPQDADHERVRQSLMDIVPAGKRGSFHVDMIRFGREICKAQNPKHDQCFLIDVCDYAQNTGIYPLKKIHPK